MYPAEIVEPMKAELTEYGFDELLTPEEVDAQMKKEGTTLVMINSVCGCSAGSARPGVLMAVHNATKKPDFLATSFAGFDTAAVARVRQYLLPYPPSSPAIALFKNGQLEQNDKKPFRLSGKVFICHALTINQVHVSQSVFFHQGCFRH